jgi:hypothetical protein
MSKFHQMLLDSLARQEAWIATLAPAEQATTRVRMALIEMAIRGRG